MEPETAISPGGSENEEGTVGNLRLQIGQLVSLLRAQKALMEECRQGRSIFEDAAAERLLVIERGDELPRARTESNCQTRLVTKRAVIHCDDFGAKAAVPFRRFGFALGTPEEIER